MILDTIPVGSLDTNCYLVGDEAAGVCVLIDPGDCPRQILEMLARSGLALQAILLTHGHFDHTGAIPEILKKFPEVPVYLHPGDHLPEDYDAQLAAAKDTLAQREAALEAASTEEERAQRKRDLHAAKYAARELIQERAYLLKGDPSQKYYGDGDTLPLGSLTIRVLHTPGHSAGSVSLLVGDLLISGDTLFTGSCGRWDLPGGDGAAIQRSLARLGALEGDLRVCPGHGPLSTLDYERKTNSYLRKAMDHETVL